MPNKSQQEELIIAVDSRLKQAGDSVSLAGEMPFESYRLGEHSFSLTKPLHYDLVLSHAGEGILASGLLVAYLSSTCDRCLEPCTNKVSAEVDEYFLFEEHKDQNAQLDEDEELDYSLVQDDAIDLFEALRSALISETPFVVLCSEDCKGLCPVCGNNLNERLCRHDKSDPLSPFAALTQLKLDKKS